MVDDRVATSPREAQLRFRHRVTGGPTTWVLHVFHVRLLPPARFTAYPLIQNIFNFNHLNLELSQSNDATQGNYYQEANSSWI
jgi:hypothetical protein